MIAYWIPVTGNRQPADAGKAFYATIEAKEWEGTWLRLDVKIYIKD